MAEVDSASEGIRLQLDAQEADIFRELLKEMRMLLEADVPPGDAVIQRLFPKAHEDETEEASYQELVKDELQQVKKEALERVETTLGNAGGLDVVISAEEADTWLRLLNDLRLAIGTRLDVDEEKMGRTYDPSDPEAPALAVLHWLGWLQGSLLEELNT